MLATIKNVFKIPDLRNKLAFSLMIIVIYRFGAHIPVPAIDLGALEQLKQAAENSGGVLGYLSLFSGGALTQFAVFALGIMPYITSSIIMQILTVVIPKLEQWQQQGAVGQRKITQWTRYLTIAIALVQATGLSYLFHNGGGGFGSLSNTTSIDLFGGDANYNFGRVSVVVITLVAGTALIMWLGELVTQRGLGNGMSLIIFSSVVASFPGAATNIQQTKGWGWAIAMLGVGIVILVGIVFVEQGQRRIPVQFAKRVVGRRMYGGQSTYIPLKVNQAGIIPIIFASSVLYLPVILSNVLPADGWGRSVRNFVDNHVVKTDSIVHIALYGLLIIAFTFFYTMITFDPHQQADTIRKQGGFIPGIRPGVQTERYLGKIVNRITWPGALFITAIALTPAIVLAFAGIENFPFAGTTLLIAVGVALETMKQIDSQLMMRNYEGFLK